MLEYIQLSTLSVRTSIYIGKWKISKELLLWLLEYRPWLHHPLVIQIIQTLIHSQALFWSE